MAQGINNDQLKLMIQNLEKKLDDNTGVLKEIAEDVKNVTKTVAVHEHRISSVEKRLEEKKVDNKWLVMAIVAVGSLILHYIKYITQ